MLDRVAAQAEAMGNLLLAARIIEQAAREVGDVRMSDSHRTSKESARGTGR